MRRDIRYNNRHIMRRPLRESSLPKYENPVFIDCSSKYDADMSVEMGYSSYESSLFYVGDCGTDAYAALEEVVDYLEQNDIIHAYAIDDEMVDEYPDDYIEVNGYYFQRDLVYVHQIVGNHGERRRY